MLNIFMMPEEIRISQDPDAEFSGDGDQKHSDGDAVMSETAGSGSVENCSMPADETAVVNSDDSGASADEETAECGSGKECSSSGGEQSGSIDRVSDDNSLVPAETAAGNGEGTEISSSCQVSVRAEAAVSGDSVKAVATRGEQGLKKFDPADAYSGRSETVEYPVEAVRGARRNILSLKLNLYAFMVVCIILAAGFVFLVLFSVQFLSNLYNFALEMVSDAVASLKDFFALEDYTAESVKKLASKYGDYFLEMRNTGRRIVFGISLLLSIPAVIVGGFSLSCAIAAKKCSDTFLSAGCPEHSSMSMRIRLAALVNALSCACVTLSLLSSWSSLLFLFTFNVSSVITAALIIRYFSVFAAMRDIVSSRRVDGPYYLLMAIFLTVIILGLILTDLTLVPLLFVVPF